MKMIIIIGILTGLIVIYFLHKYSVNKIEWFSSFYYPSEAGEYLVQDFDTKKYEVVNYDNIWFFRGARPKNFQWRKLDN